MALSRIEKKVFYLIKKFCPDQAVRILEMSPGEGNLTSALWDEGYKNIEAMDIYPENFKVRQVTCHKADLNDLLPFEDGTYDLVITVEGIEHLEYQYRFASEIRRILKNGGSLVLSTPNIGNFASRVRFLFTSFYALCTRPSSEFVKNWIIEHIYPLTFSQLRHILHTNGLFIKDITTDHIRRSSLIGILFWPISYIVTAIALNKEEDDKQRKLNVEIVKQIHSLALYFGRTQIVYCKKEKSEYKK